MRSREPASIRRLCASRIRILTGFVHDLGKVLCLFGEPQWAVVGDTFPVGCAFAPEIVHAELFEHNPDARNPEYASPDGIYAEGAGLDALTIIREHSFYTAHGRGTYAHLLGPGDARRPGRFGFNACN